MTQYHKIHGLYKRYRDGDKKGKFIMGEYSLPEFKILKDIQWLWTEKVDGTNIRVIWLGTQQILEFKGKTDKAEIPKHLLHKLQSIFKKENMKNIFGFGLDKPFVCLYGEGYGYKIQSGGKYFINPNDVGFVLFDIKIGNIWLKRDKVEEIANLLGLNIVPIIGKGTIQESINYIKFAPISRFGHKNFVMEGLVIHPEYELRNRLGHRIITKIKYKDFKEK